MDLSQEGLAELMEITYQQLQRYEKGSGQIGTDRLQALANCLEVSITYFFEDEAEVPVPAEPAAQYVTTEEVRFLRNLRKISKQEYKRSILVFLRLAAEMEGKKA